jgi:ADP-ribose pyrophosphatase YjhB (NUDIX family)
MLNLLRNKRRALNAAPVNSTMLPVRFVVKYVQIRRTLVTKEETTLASIVPRVGRPKMAVRNAKRAVRGRSVMVAKIAHWGLQEKEMTLIRRSADHVNWARQRRWKARPRAVGVI